MLELRAERTARDILLDCAKRGLVVKLDTPNTKPPGRHWHLGFLKRPGVLEMTEAAGEVTLKVADNRDGGWASALARELAGAKKRR